jgi:parallel beta-helix repeat protein
MECREMQKGCWGCAFVVAGLVIFAVPTMTSDDLCGATVVADVKLDHDLTCAGDGLVVGADGINIDLNGYSISGSGIGIGIDVTGRTNVTISGGAIRNFTAGVRVLNSADLVIRGVAFLANTDGIDLQAGSVGVTIKENTFRDTRVRGIMLRSDTRDNVIKENTFAGNRTGVLINGPVDTIVKANVITGSTLAGIRVGVTATGNTIKENWVASNLAGIEFIVSPTGVGAAGNALLKNTLTMNTCGLKGPTADNTLKDNSLEGNVADTCS